MKIGLSKIGFSVILKYALFVTLTLTVQFLALISLCQKASAQSTARQLSTAPKPAPPAITIETSSDQKSGTKILFIGQSIISVNNSPHIFHTVAIIKRPEDNFLVEMVAGGGYSLKDHYNDGTALREMRKQRWNYVVLVESTMNLIGFTRDYLQYAPFFDQEARRAGAEPLMFECYDESNTDDAHSPMHKHVLAEAERLHERIVPVGAAWRYVTKYYPGISIFGPDHHHPSLMGAYLIACVLYSTIYNQPADGADLTLEYDNPRTRRKEVRDGKTDPVMKKLADAAWAVTKQYRTMAK